MTEQEIIKIQQELINLLESQVVDISIMSKIELGYDVIEEINRQQMDFNSGFISICPFSGNDRGDRIRENWHTSATNTYANCGFCTSRLAQY